MSSSTKPTVCLCMIVKNESAIIKRCLDSARPYVDGYYIIDTGSTDDTLEIVARELRELPGTLKSEEWVNYGHNRSSLIAQAQDAGYDYLLLGDADMIFQGELGDLTAPGYQIRLAGGFEWWMPYLVSSKYHWHYYGVTHEFLSSEESIVMEKHPTFTIDHKSDGGNRTDKFTNDRTLLEEELERNPDDGRTLFYLGQTCKDQGDTDRAIELYRRRAELGGWDEETYWSLLQVGEMTGEIEDYLRAWCFRPSRPEAVQRLCRIYNDKGLFLATQALASVYLATTPPSEDLLFVEKWAYEYGIAVQLAVAAFWTGEREISKALFNAILEKDIPNDIRELVHHNLTFFESD